MFRALYAYILVAIVVFGSGYAYYTVSQNKIENLIETNTQLQTVVDSSKTTIETLTSDISRVQQDYDTLQLEFQTIRSQNSMLRQRLAEHDLEYLSLERPGLIQPIINNASRNALRCFELQSGAPLTERELNAENERDFNSECPWLFYSLVQ